MSWRFFREVRGLEMRLAERLDDSGEYCCSPSKIEGPRLGYNAGPKDREDFSSWSSSANIFEGNSNVAVGLRGAPAVRDLISESLMPWSDMDGTPAWALMSKYGPGAKFDEFTGILL